MEIKEVLNEVWFDGTCKLCGHAVYETGCRNEDGEALEQLADYKNACSNESCKENYWHYCVDQEELDYYEHKREPIKLNSFYTCK